ncbi:hypothetical protein AWB72_05639 [Caballeronia concitans]|jgi:hypothetical protein|uniref:Uncharacterized protein n=1 Tax=Caballeronia concitans TaxID=1777133 RepID=A0A658R5P6_9BURK|nr:hypothetical protein AWB72_05639 [Caballeronia concitans]
MSYSAARRFGAVLLVASQVRPGYLKQCPCYATAGRSPGFKTPENRRSRPHYGICQQSIASKRPLDQRWDKAKARHHSLLAAHSQGRWPLAGAVAGGFDFSSTFGVELSMSVGRAPRRLSKIYLNHVTAVCASVPVARVHCRSRSSIRRQAQLSPNTIDHCKSSPLFGVRRSSRLPSPRDTRRP